MVEVSAGNIINKVIQSSLDYIISHGGKKYKSSTRAKLFFPAKWENFSTYNCISLTGLSGHCSISECLQSLGVAKVTDLASCSERVQMCTCVLGLSALGSPCRCNELPRLYMLKEQSADRRKALLKIRKGYIPWWVLLSV